jgi:phospholipid N-methyltransferase
MIELTRLVGEGVVASVDFTGVNNIVEVGGGHGELLARILAVHPHMRGNLVELEHAIEDARQVKGE